MIDAEKYQFGTPTLWLVLWMLAIGVIVIRTVRQSTRNDRVPKQESPAPASERRDGAQTTRHSGTHRQD